MFLTIKQDNSDNKDNLVSSRFFYLCWRLEMFGKILKYLEKNLEIFGKNLEKFGKNLEKFGKNLQKNQ